MRRPAKRDANHGEIADRFRALGCTVLDTEMVGDGFPDMVVGLLGINRIVEVKNPATRYGRGGLNPNQAEFNARWRGEKVWLVSSVDEATALVQNWRKGSVWRGNTTG